MAFFIWVVIIVLLIPVVYFGVGAVAALSLTKISDHPQYDDDPGTFGLAFESVSFPAREDHVKIASWYIPKQGAEKVILLVHGRDASKQNAISGKLPQLAAELHRAGLAVLMIDLRGHGDSGGRRYTFGAHERRDVLGGVDYLLAQGFAPGQIAVLGISLGGAAVIGAAAVETAIGTVVVESTFADISLLVAPNWKAESGLPLFFLPSVFFMWKLLLGFDLRKVKPVEELAKIPPRPILILHSETDEIIDVKHAHAMKTAVPEAKMEIFNDCSHAELFRDQPDKYFDVVLSFFQRYWEM